MRRSTEEEIHEAQSLVCATHAKIEELLQKGKKVHVIWDFDGVLADSRSDDVFALVNRDLKTYFAYEERLLMQSPGSGIWLQPIAHNVGIGTHFPSECFSQDIVTVRSSYLSLRMHIFCLSWHLPVRWTLHLGHQSKEGAYRIILDSLKNYPDYHFFCIDDNAKHVEIFGKVSKELGVADRAFGVVSPIIRTYTQEELQEHFNRVMQASGDAPIRVRDSTNDIHGFIVLPGGVKQFAEKILDLVSENSSRGHDNELRAAFIKVFGEVGPGHFKTEEELELAMKDFILGLHCP